MVEFKLTVNDPKTGKSYQKEAKDDSARVFVGMKIGQQVKGESFGMTGYEFLITGGSDKCGFPLRSGIKGKRQKVFTYGGVGVKCKGKGVKIRKTVCGNLITADVSQINLKVTQMGKTPLEEKKEGEAEEKKEEVKKEEKPAEKKTEPKKEEKAAEDKK